MSPRTVSAATDYPGGFWEPGPPKYGVQVVDNVLVPMSDGTVLRSTVAYPTDLATGERAAGRFPVALEYTPYRTSVPPGSGPVNTYPPQYGYISAKVNTRGTLGSAESHAFQHFSEGRDGAEVVRWAANQLEGSDGRVALIGCSFPAAMALEAAAQVGRHSPLKAMIAGCMGLEGVARESYFTAGVPTQVIQFSFNSPGTVMAGSPQTVAYHLDLAKEILAGGERSYFRQYWKERGAFENARRIVDAGVPTLLWSGWQDRYENTALRTYAAFQNAYFGRPLGAAMRPGQRTTARYQVIMGDWGHGAGMDNGVYLQWLETWVKGAATGIEHTSTPLHLLELGTDRWINAATFPAVGRYKQVYLGDGLLDPSRRPPRDGALPLMRGEPELPGNKLSYNSPPYAEGATLAGPMSATVYAGSSSTNLLLIAELYDEAPDGTSRQITSGAILGSQRALDRSRSYQGRDGDVIWPYQRRDEDEYLEPGRVYRLEIPLDARQYGLKPGHRLRLELSAQAPAVRCGESPQRPGAGHDPCWLTPQQQGSVGGTYTIMHGRSHPSSLNLPLLPWMAFATVESRLTPTPNDRQKYALPMDWGSKKRQRSER